MQTERQPLRNKNQIFLYKHSNEDGNKQLVK